MKDSELHGDHLRTLLQTGYSLAWSAHETIQEEARNISSKHASEAFDNGECIRYVVFNDAVFGLTQEWLWMGYAKTGFRTYRPLHLPLLVQPNGSKRVVTVGTVYDPDRSPWMWDKTQTVRLCWKKEPNRLL